MFDLALLTGYSTKENNQLIQFRVILLDEFYFYLLAHLLSTAFYLPYIALVSLATTNLNKTLYKSIYSLGQEIFQAILTTQSRPP